MNVKKFQSHHQNDRDSRLHHKITNNKSTVLSKYDKRIYSWLPKKVGPSYLYILVLLFFPFRF